MPPLPPIRQAPRFPFLLPIPAPSKTFGRGVSVALCFSATCTYTYDLRMSLKASPGLHTR
eukprot:scaffold7031_cov118-Isochrysis_galbana.AAC.1